MMLSLLDHGKTAVPAVLALPMLAMGKFGEQHWRHAGYLTRWPSR